MWEGGSGWGIHVNPWLMHVNEWQKPLQYCKVISLQLIKINEKIIIIKYASTKKKKKEEKTKIHLVKAMVFPLVMYGCDSWTIKKAEC